MCFSGSVFSIAVIFEKEGTEKGTSSGDATRWPTEAGESTLRDDFNDAVGIPESSLLRLTAEVHRRTDAHFGYSSIKLTMSLVAAFRKIE
ncbi:hypothetical protein ANTPLA_LOCUS3495 [Anthophora plagiata]